MIRKNLSAHGIEVDSFVKCNGYKQNTYVFACGYADEIAVIRSLQGLPVEVYGYWNGRPIGFISQIKC